MHCGYFIFCLFLFTVANMLVLIRAAMLVFAKPFSNYNLISVQ